MRAFSALLCLAFAGCDTLTTDDVKGITAAVGGLEDVAEKGLRLRDQYENPGNYRPAYQPTFRGYNAYGQPIYY